jgi:hypothetical protein
MKFMLMINVPYANGEYQHQQYTAAAWQAHSQFQRELNRALTRSGEFVEVHALQPPGKTRIVRHADGRAPVISDGPFAETKEFLAGFWIVEVKSRERALEIAALASSAPGPDGKPCGNPIEVREVMWSPSPEELS